MHLHIYKQSLYARLYLHGAKHEFILTPPPPVRYSMGHSSFSPCLVVTSYSNSEKRGYHQRPPICFVVQRRCAYVVVSELFTCSFPEEMALPTRGQCLCAVLSARGLTDSTVSTATFTTPFRKTASCNYPTVTLFFPQSIFYPKIPNLLNDF